ncbi:MAG: CooT family nickel-binding protein [Clostridia bacterium]|nr:CooT family nickel-binding protein [Clostridia bacterium]MBQ8972447.1 CooT family nickel-binding protein [Clostridia bacterium]
MCLSTVYRSQKSPENEILSNVMMIECKDGVVTLTDIMGREEKIEGDLIAADLTRAYAIVEPRAKTA